MAYIMYVCPECRKVFKVNGNDKKVKCNQCGDIYLSDMHLSMEQWQNTEIPAREKHISAFLAAETVYAPGQSQPDTEIKSDTSKRSSFFQEVPSKVSGRLRDFKCPNCNAALKVTESAEQAKCDYCGATFNVDDGSQRIKYEFENTRQAGFDFERGRLDAQNMGVSDVLLSRLSNAIDISRKRETLSQTLSQLQNQLTAREKTEKELSSFANVIAPYLIAAAIAGVMFLYLLTGSAHIVLRIFLFLASLGGAYLAMKYTQNSIAAKKEKVAEEIEGINEKINSNTYELNGLGSTDDLEMIPPKYRTLEALECMYDFLVNKRALNIQQAINLYEDKKHHDEIERMHREQIELQRQEIEDLKRMNTQKNNSGSAIGSALQAGAAAAFTLSVIKEIKDDLF